MSDLRAIISLLPDLTAFLYQRDRDYCIGKLELSREHSPLHDAPPTLSSQLGSSEPGAGQFDDSNDS